MATDRHPFFEDLAAYCSLGAGIVHAAAVGVHAEHPATARVFVVLALAQAGAGLTLMRLGARWWQRVLVVGVNVAAFVGWLMTRTTGIPWIDGLQTSESPQTADILAALLALVAIVASVWPMLFPSRLTRSLQPSVTVAIATVLTVPAMFAGATHVHSHDDHPVETSFQIGADGVIVLKDTTTTVAATTTSTPADASANEASAPAGNGTAQPPRPHRTTTVPAAATTSTQPTASHTHSTTPEQRLAAQSGWPRPFDPAAGPDFNGVAGVTEIQFTRARNIIADTARDLAKYATTAAAAADGYRSIGDSITGYEHWIKWELIPDGRVLDSKAPESLVYRVDGSSRTLVSAMYMAQPGTNINDPALVDYAGPLMQWHVHDNLCFLNGRVVGLVAPGQACTIGSNNGALSPMVHVWIAPHPCGPFAAVEGVAAGVAQASDEERLDLCNRH